ncbi:cupredoxin domain-containing protein [Natronorubrum thiooxidans]|uniref:Copper binding protein, plastocyanin/azurin family n=1 Tax=Natronorubrum thiooxidans TaxID=308853 RepID=A0A1N7E870_9EURY|nr:plastocyanin/azurin family copper-binding protein [Natronorubrum thiooxidans]SIR84271.1 Copper binding protein, plastocyanin/azurin family [Natronorubrum thiooxidans]
MSELELTRRTALGLVGTTAAATGLTTATAAQDTESDEPTDDDGQADGETDRRPIILAGRSEYWYGIAPEEIEGEENPTLSLEAGETYDLVWINVDGAEHELIVESDAGEELAVSDESETAGETVSMTFEASEDAAEYYCEYHPDAMRGTVELNGGFDLSSHGHDEHGHDHDGNGQSNGGDGGY